MPAETTLHYQCFGDANKPAVVLLHGFMGNTQDWGPVIDRLTPSFLCLAIDLPGHGRSLHLSEEAFTFSGAASAVARVLQANAVTPTALIGYSLGGRIALYLAVHYPRLCAALVVESASAGISDKKKRDQRRGMDEKWARRLEQGVFEEFLRTWYSQPVFSSLARKPVLLEEMIRRRYLNNDPRCLARALRGFSVGLQPPLWDDLPFLRLPVLLITGERDKKYTDLLNAMADRLPTAGAVIIPDAGHNVHAENPNDYAESVIAFLTEQKISVR